MGFFSRFFGKHSPSAGGPKSSSPAPPGAPTSEEVAENLVKRIELVEREKKVLEQQIREKMAKGDKRGASVILMRLRRKEKEIERLEGFLENTERLNDHKQQAMLNKIVYDSQRLAVKEMKQNQVSVNEVEDTTDKMHETMDEVQEVNDLLSRPLDMSADVNVEEELERIYNEGHKVAEESLPEITVPKTKLSTKHEETDELKKLEAELNA